MYKKLGTVLSASYSSYAYNKLEVTIVKEEIVVVVVS